jgi:hypothetical protein
LTIQEHSELIPNTSDGRIVVRSFAIESNGTFLGEIACIWEDPTWEYDVNKIDIDSRPVVLAEYDGKQRFVRIVGVTDVEGETLTPPGETEPIQALVYYGIPA